MIGQEAHCRHSAQFDDGKALHSLCLFYGEHQVLAHEQRDRHETSGGIALAMRIAAPINPVGGPFG